jgi:hypothetical protein
MMLGPMRMTALAYLRARYPTLLRLGWLALVIVLAACNNGAANSGSGGGGGGPGY